MVRNVTPERAPFFKPGPAEKLLFDKTVCIPAVNIEDTAEHYMLTVAVPGLKREYFEIIIKQQVITVSASKKDNASKNRMDRREYDYSDWSRSFRLPFDADVILAKAAYRNGELRVRIPKSAENIGIENPLIVYVY